MHERDEAAEEREREAFDEQARIEAMERDFDPDEDGEDDDAAEECGRWHNGKLSPQCRKAGSEECDWVCPIGLERRSWP
jgi:hypothetical protein